MTEVRTVSSTGGEKGVKSARFDLIPAGPLWQLALLMGKGAEKYESRNWERGYEWSKSYGALCRHLNLFWQGVDLDDETMLPHLAAVAWHAFALLEFASTHPEFDDRPAPDTSYVGRHRPKVYIDFRADDPLVDAFEQFAAMCDEGLVFDGRRRRPVDECTLPDVQRWHDK